MNPLIVALILILGMIALAYVIFTPRRDFPIIAIAILIVIFMASFLLISVIFSKKLDTIEDTASNTDAITYPKTSAEVYSFENLSYYNSKLSNPYSKDQLKDLNNPNELLRTYLNENYDLLLQDKELVHYDIPSSEVDKVWLNASKCCTDLKDYHADQVYSLSEELMNRYHLDTDAFGYYKVTYDNQPTLLQIRPRLNKNTINLLLADIREAYEA